MGQYFDNDDLKSSRQKHEIELLGNKFSFYTDNGVFSKRHLDYGTRLLLESIPLNNIGDKVLDMGCGYGIIGIVIGKLMDVHVDMVDVNRRALHLAKMNAKENNLDNVNIFESDCYSQIKDKYSTIISNPPIRAGKKVVYEMLLGAKQHLCDNGQLFLVVRKEQGAKSLIFDLKKEYNVEVLKRSKGFFVIKCIL